MEIVSQQGESCDDVTTKDPGCQSVQAAGILIFVFICAPGSWSGRRNSARSGVFWAG